MGSDTTQIVDARVGWLLKSWRRRSHDPRLTMQAPFAERLAQVAPHVSVDASRVSRWESGRIRASRAIVAGYESALGLPEHLLVATVEVLWRDHGMETREPGPPLPRAEAVRGLDDCLALLAAGEHDGGTWHRLAGLVTSQEMLVYLPEALREETAQALVGEVPRSVGRAWLRRIEAMRQMLGHELVGPHVVRAIGRQVTEPSSQAVVDLVANLHDAGGIAPIEMLVRLTSHESESVRTGALWGLGDHGVPQELSPGLTRQLSSTLATVITGDSPRNVDLAFRLAGELGPQSSGPLAPLLRRRRAAEASAEAQVERAVIRRSAASAMEVVGVDVDDVLRDLLEEALGMRGADAQHESWMVLMASPFRSDLADHLVTVCASGDHLLDAHATGLTYLATEEHRDGVVKLAGRDDIDAGIRFRALAHVPGAVVPDDLGVPSPAEMYALGMTESPRLRRLVDDPDAPADVRGAARWWIQHGGALHDPGG
ncbi:helix-turn-helix domain-containing protein [Solicola sp. PLA-1-18]|uniref:helix-turn-helix domain-containing protein n=1 Tax=Solicola sp. PLA-1-18 TaxID=3380532 RepID=UPI003B7F296E